MDPGIRAEVSLHATATCPVARYSARAGAPAESITWGNSGQGTVTEEFALGEELPADADVETVFSAESRTIYRFERDGSAECPCASIEQLGQPIDDVFTRNGRLHVTFHAPDIDGLRSVIGELRDRYDGVDVRRLVRSGGDSDAADLVFVDRATLTDRQREVLETAHDMGYFEHPKEANAGEVADALDITTSTYTEHLAAAQRKILSAIIEG